MYNILYPTDFSEQAGKIARLALDFAKQCNAHLHILHINAIPMISTDMPVDALDNLIKSQDEQASKQMQQFCAELSAHYPAISGEVRTGILTEAINEFADEKGINLVLMSTHGAHGIFEKFFMGSNTEKLIRRSKLPILVLPENASAIKCSRILYASDLEADESKALQDLRIFADTVKAELSAIHIDSDNKLDIFSNETQVKRIKSILGEHVMLHSIKTDKIREGLEEFVTAHGYDILAATRVDRGFIDNFFHSSLTSELVYNSRIALLILHN